MDQGIMQETLPNSFFLPRNSRISQAFWPYKIVTSSSDQGSSMTMLLKASIVGDIQGQSLLVS
jgi:hypothetical protein